MASFKLSFLILAAFFVNVTFSQNPPIHIDVGHDIPLNGNWDVDCDSGYERFVSDFDCAALGEGKVNLPEEDLSITQVGFWTNCVNRCRITYRTQLGDFVFGARVYQMNRTPTRISYDGANWEDIPGDGWVEIKIGLSTEVTIHLELDHLSADHFALLDRIVVNDELPPIEDIIEPTTEDEPTTATTESPPESTTESTTEHVESTTGRNPTTYIDIQSDIPANGHWVIDCPLGYRENVSEFNCRDSGRVDLPSEDLSDQVGFWTNCGDRCSIKYIIQPGDTTYAARVYQRDLMTEISTDGVNWEFVPGDKWVDIERDLTNIVTEISMRFDHLSPDFFVVLDKIAVNGDLPPMLPRKAENLRAMQSPSAKRRNKYGRRKTRT